MEAMMGIMLVAVFVVFLLCIRLPIIIAERRGVSESDLKTISVLSWLGVFFGLTWIIALILAFVYAPSKEGETVLPPSFGDIESVGQAADTLLKLNELREKGIITQEEFDRKKEQLLR